ncbi:MAG TPA: hypothetical protein GXX42_00485 [Petrimonas sp.]|nr:hypothetical protein [Petrimonas sp.]
MINGIENFFQIVAAANQTAFNGDDSHIAALNGFKSVTIHGGRQILLNDYLISNLKFILGWFAFTEESFRQLGHRK